MEGQEAGFPCGGRMEEGVREDDCAIFLTGGRPKRQE